MTEENQVQQVTKEPQQVTKEPHRVTTKNPKKVEAGKRLVEHNHKKKEEQRKEQAKLEKTAGRGFTSGVNQYYGIGAIIALGVIGGLGYYIYQSKKGEQPSNPQQNNSKPHPQAIAVQGQSNKFEWIKSLLYYKNGQEEYS